MPEEKNGAAGQKRAGLPPESGTSPAPAGTGDSQQGRRASLRWAMGAGMIAATLAATFNLVYYLQVGAWQILAVVVVMALAIVCLLPAAFLARTPGSGDGVGGQGRHFPILRGPAAFDAAGAWVVIVMLLGFALTELFHQGVTLFLAPGGAVLILIVGLMVMPRRWPLLLVLVAAYGLYMILVNWLEPSLPFARYDMGQLGQNSNVFAFLLVFCLLVAALAGIVRAYRSIVTIRLRLPASFSLVVLLTVTLLGAAVLYVASGSGRQQSVRQLDAVASIKEAEIQRWVGAVETDLSLVLEDIRVLPRMLIMLQDPRLADAQELYVWNSMSQVAGRSELLDSLLLLDPAGQVIVSTDVAEKGQDRSDAAYFQEGLQGFSVQPPVYSATDEAVVLVASRPVVDGQGDVAGVLVANLSLPPLAAMLGRQAWMGDTGEVYMVDRSGALLTDLRFADGAPAPASAVGSFSVGPESQSRSAVFRDYRGQQVVAFFDWLSDLEVGLVAKQDQSEALRVTYSLMLTVAVAALGVLVVAVGVSLALTRGITRPLDHLTAHSARVAAGDLSLMVEMEQKDEIGALAQTLNTMTSQMSSLVAGLEDRVAERTRELERRSRYLQASAEVGRAATSILDPDRLGREAVYLIGRRFAMESVALYLVDETGDEAVLQAAMGGGADVTWAGGPRVRIGEGVVGRCLLAAHQDPGARGQYATIPGQPPASAWARFSPSSPETLSEGQTGGVAKTTGEGEQVQAALPLRSRGQVLGAIAVQTSGVGALDRDTLVVLQTAADQVAVAIDNARLFVASQRALDAERRAYGQVSQQAWAQVARSQPVRGYRSDARGVAVLDRPLLAHQPASQSGSPGDGSPGGIVLVQDGEAEGQIAIVPILVRDQVIGQLHFRKEGAGQTWNRDEVALLQSMADQTGQALESARLYQDVQRSAARDRVLAGVTGRMRESLQIDTVLQAAVQEMRRAMDLSEVEVRLVNRRPGAGSGSD